MVKKHRKRVSIIGLGWLGMPLAEHLAALGWQVKGSKRQAFSHSQVEILPFDLQDLPQNPPLALLSKLNSLIITIPPNAAPCAESYQSGIKRLVSQAILQQVPHLIFINSTGVFPQVAGRFDEHSATDLNNSTAQLEQWLLAQPIACDILRLAGLIGKNRHPVFYLAGKTHLTNANQPVNLVHQADCIAAIQRLLETPNGKRIFHLVAPQHPTRQAFYTAMAEKLKLPPLHFAADNKPLERVISGEKICRELGFEYQFVDPFLMTN